MKIVVTKDEFARLVRECESKFNTSSCCYNCIMNTFCQGEGKIEDFCEIESSVNSSNGLFINPCAFRKED